MRIWSALTLLLLALTGCFPYREVYRPAVSGIVLDDDGHPATGVAVLTCSASRWAGLHADQGCPRQGITRTAADGSFSLPRFTEWTWCCLGEAPLPITAVTACAPDGSIGGMLIAGQGPLRIQLTPPPVFRANHRQAEPDADFFFAVCRQNQAGTKAARNPVRGE